MRRILPFVILVLLFACQKKDTPSPQRNFYGKWYFVEAVAKHYTVSNGDTTYSLIDTTRYSHSTDYLDFTTNGVALRFTSSSQQTDSLLFEEVTPVYFRLDSLLCEVNSIEDSVLRFNSLDFLYDDTPKVKITQVFYTMQK